MYSSSCVTLRLISSHRPLLSNCLQRRKRATWNSEGVARAQYRYAKTLEALDRQEEADNEGQKAAKIRKQWLRDYSDKLRDDPDEEVVHDRMVSMWQGGLSRDMREPTPA